MYVSDTWSNSNDHTIGQSGFNAEVSHHHGLGEQNFMQSLNTISVTLQYNSQHQSPSIGLGQRPDQ